MRRIVGVHEIDEEGGGVGFLWDHPKRREIHVRVRVGVARVSVGDLGVVVEDVADVPVEDDVVEAEVAFGRVPEFLR